MKHYLLVLVALLLFMGVGCNTDGKILELRGGDLVMGLDEHARVISLMDGKLGTDHSVQGGPPSYLMSIKVGDSIMVPDGLNFVEDTLKVHFPNSSEAQVLARSKETHVVFELLSLTGEDSIDAIVWGPYHSKLSQSIGETIGIVQGVDFTIGLQALNLKTLGGYPWNDNDHLPQLDIFRQKDVENMVRDEGNRGVLYSVEAGKPTEYGSSLQAYTRNRMVDRVIANRRHERFVAPAYDDGGLVGSKIALFGCKTKETLETIGKIELAEGLPHPTIDGEWVKTSPIINSSYLIMDFTEATIDRCLEYAQKSGFNYLYHGHPFASWGHFPLLRKQFPNGYEGMKTCVEKARAVDIHLGTHMLTNFINVNDSYVSPIPDRRLALVGSSHITEDIDERQTTIPIEDPGFFNQFKNNHLRSVLIGDEIIRYGSVSAEAPWELRDCQRGAFGTGASAHSGGDKIGKLMDHGYKVFLGNAKLNREIAGNMADFMNRTGVRMLDFDGLEGAGGSTGMGNYGEILFADAWYNALNEDLRNHFVLGASRPGHYFWHYYSRMNWGEPWYAGFRESQTQYRLDNQAYFKRNLMPGMLGWFKMTPSTTIEDIEWLMTRSAAYNAGFAFVVGFDALEQNGRTEEIFSLLNNWETARLNGLFSEEQQKRMQDLTTEFHLERTDTDDLLLTQMYSHKFEHLKKVRQPGEPLYTNFEFDNKGGEQSIGFIVSAVSGDLADIRIEIDNHYTLEWNLVLKRGRSLIYKGGDQAVVLDENGHKLQVLPLNKEILKLGRGKHSLTFDCVFKNEGEAPKAKVELRLKGTTETL
ncbi:MAG: hypothetical protein AB3N16_04660 [Flavobacteriaceae bacterium]